MKILALADDATGALETGARFSEAGLEARVSFESSLIWNGDALVVDTETRHLPSEQARQKIYEIATRAKAARVSHVYKKTDSTLRGPIAAEFRALLEVWPEMPLIYAAAYPALGRTVRNGQLLVNGQALAETVFAADLLNPSRESSISQFLGGLSDGRVRICDCETDEELAAIAASAVGTPCLVAGTAALASAWAGRLVGRAPRAWRPKRTVRNVLVVCGSLHPASREQFHQSGIATLEHCLHATPSDLGADLAALITREQWAGLCTTAVPRGDPLEVAASLARATAAAIRLAKPDCLVIFGGDTVFAILRELAIQEVNALGEVLPGMPVSESAGGQLLLTKAGGFGTPDYLARLRAML